MAEEGPLTPERELLKLIEEPGEKKDIAVSAKAKHRITSLFSPAALRGRFSFLRAKFKGGVKFPNLAQLEIRFINRVLELTIVILICYLIANFVVSMLYLTNQSTLRIDIKKDIASLELPEASFLRPVSYYLEKARIRDIFKMGLSSVSDSRDAKEVPKAVISAASEKFKLVGISWSDDPDAIIEDVEQKRAYFLKRGQKINGFSIKAIFKDKVILSYKGEEVELK